MKFAADRPFANLDAAVKKLLEIAKAMEVDHAGRLDIGTINRTFFNAGGSVAEYGAAVKAQKKSNPKWVVHSTFSKQMGSAASHLANSVPWPTQERRFKSRGPTARHGS